MSEPRPATIIISDWLANCQTGQWTPFEAATALKTALTKEGYEIRAAKPEPSRDLLERLRDYLDINQRPGNDLGPKFSAEISAALAAKPERGRIEEMSAVVNEMIEVATDDDDSVMAEWTSGNRAEIDKWQVRLQIAIRALKGTPA